MVSTTVVCNGGDRIFFFFFCPAYMNRNARSEKCQLDALKQLNEFTSSEGTVLCVCVYVCVCGCVWVCVKICVYRVTLGIF